MPLVEHFFNHSHTYVISGRLYFQAVSGLSEQMNKPDAVVTHYREYSPHSVIGYVILLARRLIILHWKQKQPPTYDTASLQRVFPGTMHQLMGMIYSPHCELSPEGLFIL